MAVQAEHGSLGGAGDRCTVTQRRRRRSDIAGAGAHVCARFAANRGPWTDRAAAHLHDLEFAGDRLRVADQRLAGTRVAARGVDAGLASTRYRGHGARGGVGEGHDLRPCAADDVLVVDSDSPVAWAPVESVVSVVGGSDPQASAVLSHTSTRRSACRAVAKARRFKLQSSHNYRSRRVRTEIRRSSRASRCSPQRWSTNWQPSTRDRPSQRSRRGR